MHLLISYGVIEMASIVFFCADKFIRLVCLFLSHIELAKHRQKKSCFIWFWGPNKGPIVEFLFCWYKLLM